MSSGGPQNQIERPDKKAGINESVAELLKQKEATEKADVTQPVTEKIQGDVADVMAGIEAPKPKEKPNEKAGERGSEQMPTGKGGAQGDQHAAMLQGMKSQSLPTPEVMIKKIRTKIEDEIQIEMKRAEKLKGQLSKGSAHEYNSSIARVRKLKHLLYQLLTATFDFIKDMYLRFFKIGKKP